MWIGWIEFDLLLGDVHSLKAKRSVVRPLVAELRRRFPVSAAEAGHADLHRRALVGAGLVAGERARVVEVLDELERFVAARPELELLSARRGLRRSDED
ncbi:DUF503 domain-containing protein [Kocuria sp. LUK]|uniref:DUF503 domain-containing protein n=1 Tax=Kocuria flava TaxID=446860 RepID=A0A2N4T4E5_9MICC|nr:MULTISPECIES: DUF503 domain-containing protein [Kocuria]MCD1145132.1 DUF503 domain-containing protein [Kocuria sp. LUK]MCJ8505738.1 DUF503 domain-containing protein [Kocuria flava]PLC13076.1 hypothetical protein AUQ48_13675 [Kocuria flava]